MSYENEMASKPALWHATLICSRIKAILSRGGLAAPKSADMDHDATLETFVNSGVHSADEGYTLPLGWTIWLDLNLSSSLAHELSEWLQELWHFLPSSVTFNMGKDIIETPETNAMKGRSPNCQDHRSIHF
jgi:hypothetical protein